MIAIYARQSVEKKTASASRARSSMRSERSSPKTIGSTRTAAIPARTPTALLFIR